MTCHSIECVATKVDVALPFKFLRILNRYLLLVPGRSKVAFMSLTVNSTQIPSGRLFAWAACSKLNT